MNVKVEESQFIPLPGLETIMNILETSIMRIAKDIMTLHPKTVGSGDEMLQTTKVFIENGIHFCPVVTPMGEIIGVLSEYNLVLASLRHYLDPDKHEKVINHRDILIKPSFVEESASLDDVIKALHQSETHRVLVRDPRGKLVGIISPRDILNLLVGESKSFSNLREELEKKRKETLELTSKLTDMAHIVETYRKLYDESPYSMHSVDATGHVVMANRKLYEMLEYEPGELSGVPVTQLYADSIKHEVIHGLRTVIETGHHHNIYTTMVTKSGKKLRVDVASSSLRDDQDRFMNTITISRQIDSEALLRALHGIKEFKTD